MAVFSCWSAVVGIGLSLLQAFGFFSRIDAACYGLPSWNPAELSIQPDGILLVLLLTILPGPL